MSDWIIKVENLGKRYRLRHNRQNSSYVALRDVIADRLKRLCRVPGATPQVNDPARSEDFWALRDVDFEIKQGEAVGIIGRNGAGKSTLLKILSRITAPTEGRVTLRGRVASLLEVGTGFHPELTGRENILLNGTIMGMKRSEIRRKFDEIVAFADVEKFLDTPVKRYSSGMYVRLAFAVAANLEPQILVVDEVLAVGDAAFQKKCLGKMQDVANTEGRTVLFVSHNMGAVSRLCHRALLLKDGRIVDQGPSDAVVRNYLRSGASEITRCEFRVEERPELAFQILSIAVTTPKGELVPKIGLWDSIQIRVDYVVRRRLRGANAAVWLSRDGSTVFQSFDTDLSPEVFAERAPGYYRTIIPLPTCLLPVGTYIVSASTGMPSLAVIDVHHDVVSFEVAADGEDITNKSYSRQAMVIAKLPWTTEILNTAPGD